MPNLRFIGFCVYTVAIFLLILCGVDLDLLATLICIWVIGVLYFMDDDVTKIGNFKKKVARDKRLIAGLQGNANLYKEELKSLQEEAALREQELEALKLEVERLKEEGMQPWWKKVV